jgi:ribonuclease P protein component
MGHLSSRNPQTFPRTHRLRTQRQFDAVYQRGAGKTVGPLRVIGLPNDLGHSRLGLSISRRIGTAVVRNRLKRMVREAFRLSQHDLPAGYDLIVVARPHEPLKLEDYQRLLADAAGKLDKRWTKAKSHE